MAGTTKKKSVSPAKTTFSFTAELERSDNKLWGSHIRVPVKAAEALISGGAKRIVCTLEGAPAFQCAILFYKKGLPVISVNKSLCTKLQITYGDEVHAEIGPDTSAYGLPMPEELKEVFRQDPAGKKVFHTLTPGKQRTLLYIINKPKDPDKRIGRSLVIVQHLKEQKGGIDYKKLSRSLKEAAF